LDGHIKLTDFGLAKQDFNESSISYTFCGSPEYMTPEMLSQEGHGFSLDCYTLGVLLYEMLTGLPPYYSRDTQQMYIEVVKSKVSYPNYLSKDAVSLMKGLLQKDPKKRLTVNEVKKHKFFSSVNWEDLIKKKVRSSYELNYCLTYFDPECRSLSISSFDELRRCYSKSSSSPIKKRNKGEFYIEEEDLESLCKELREQRSQSVSTTPRESIKEQLDVFSAYASITKLNKDSHSTIHLKGAPMKNKGQNAKIRVKSAEPHGDEIRYNTVKKTLKLNCSNFKLPKSERLMPKVISYGKRSVAEAKSSLNKTKTKNIAESKLYRCGSIPTAESYLTEKNKSKALLHNSNFLLPPNPKSTRKSPLDKKGFSQCDNVTALNNSLEEEHGNDKEISNADRKKGV